MPSPSDIVPDPDVAPDAIAARPAGWRYLELTYDTRDRTQVVIDGAPLHDGRAAPDVIAELGDDGWEMVGSGASAGTWVVLWFRFSAERASTSPVQSTTAAATDTPRSVPGHPAVHPAGTGLHPETHTVVLVAIGNARYDRDLHRQLVAAVGRLSGSSGWRATRIVDKAPRVVAEGVSLAQAERMRAELQGLGATVEVR